MSRFFSATKSPSWSSRLLFGLFAAMLTSPVLALEGVPEIAWLAQNPTEVVKALGATRATPSPTLTISAPTAAASGDSIPVTIASTRPDTERICLIARDNPFPLVVCARFFDGAIPTLTIRIRAAKTTTLLALGFSKTGVVSASRPIQVGSGGCGPDRPSISGSKTAATSDTKIRVRANSGVADAYVRIAHPMPRPVSKAAYRSTDFVSRVEISAGGRRLAEFALGPSVSDNPYLVVRYRPSKPPERVTATWKDQAGKRQSASSP